MGEQKQHISAGILAHVSASRREPRKIPLKYGKNRT